MRRIFAVLATIVAVGVSGCSGGDVGALLVGGGLAYWVVDPRAPNWNVNMDSVSPTDYKISLKMKNFTNGGEGEARMVFHHAAEELAQRERSPAYEILAYEEGINSEFLGGRRYAVGVVRLQKMAPLREEWEQQTGI